MHLSAAEGHCGCICRLDPLWQVHRLPILMQLASIRPMKLWQRSGCQAFLRNPREGEGGDLVTSSDSGAQTGSQHSAGVEQHVLCIVSIP